MKILSFDVGIVNLAYCIIDKYDNNDFKILDWGIINLDNSRKCCSFIMRNNKQCNNNATYTYVVNNQDTYLCRSHKNKNIQYECDKQTCNDDSVCSYKNSKNIVCGKKGKYFIDNETYCTTHSKSTIKKKSTMAQPKKININSNKIPIDKLATKLFTTLDTNKHFLDCDIVLIENQPSLKNPTMKTISSFLYSYFCIRGIIDVKFTSSKINSVNFISPSNKLKINAEHTDKIIDKENNNKSIIYDITKALGIVYTKALLESDSTNLEFINNQSKSDDLCDAFLQAFYYAYKKNNNVLPEKYAKLLHKVSGEIINNKKNNVNKNTNDEQKNNKDTIETNNNTKNIKKIKIIKK